MIGLSTMVLVSRPHTGGFDEGCLPILRREEPLSRMSSSVVSVRVTHSPFSRTLVWMDIVVEHDNEEGLSDGEDP